MVYTPLFQTEDTLALTMDAGANSATLTSGNFGSPTSTEIIVVDYKVPAKAAAFKCSISGTAITSMVKIAGPDVEHAAGASVGSVVTPEHYRVLATMEGMSSDVLAGWITANETWTYASATTIAVPTDATTKYMIGDKIRWKQGGAYKYAVISNVAATLLTVSGEAVTNAAITDNYYSKANSPVGMGGSGVLGYAEITGDVTTTSSTVAQVAGLTSTVTIPAGGRYVKVSAYGYLRHSLDGEIITMSIWDGTVGSGTQVAQAAFRAASNNQDAQQIAIAYLKPSAGVKTYNVGIKIGTNATGTGTLLASATNKAYIAVEYLGGI